MSVFIQTTSEVSTRTQQKRDTVGESLLGLLLWRREAKGKVELALVDKVEVDADIAGKLPLVNSSQVHVASRKVALLSITPRNVDVHFAL